jgi:hypothetical protein
MTAQRLINRLEKICRQNNIDPTKVEVNFRNCPDSDIKKINHIWEDLYDESNCVLTSISLATQKP